MPRKTTQHEPNRQTEPATNALEARLLADLTARITELFNPSASSASPTQEDQHWGRLAGGDEEDYFWRRLSDNWYQKDVLPSTYLEIHNQCYESYNANPLSFAIIELTTSFVLGKGVRVAARSPRVQHVLDAFWHDPDNHMESRIYDICTELSLYGEIFIRFFVNTFDGKVKVRMIDPSIIDEVETDPDDIETQIRFHQRPLGPAPAQSVDTLNATDPRPIRDVPPTDPTLAGRWFEAGTEVVHFAINKVSNAKRGKSDLATLLPWLRRYKDWLTDRVRINKYKSAFLWDVTLRGADQKTIAAKKMEYSYPPEPGSVIIHNEAEQWQAVEPAINADDAFQDGRAIKLMVAIGATLPEHYLSDGDNNNRATATQMGLPTFLKFKRRQQVIKNILRVILDRVLLEAQRVGRLSKNLDLAHAYELILPEFDVEDNQQMGNAINYLMQGLTAARGAGWISNETAMQLLFKFCDLEVDVNEERARIQAEQQSRSSLAGLNERGLPGSGPDETEQPAESPLLRDQFRARAGVEGRDHA